MKKIILLFIIVFINCAFFAQSSSKYKPVRKVKYSLVNNRIRKSTTTYTPVVKNKQVAVVTTIKKDDAPAKSFITYKKKRLVYWKARTKTQYSPIIK